jgi:hypothetical protein
VGFQHIQVSACELLTEIFSFYVNRIGVAVEKRASLCSRTEVNALDLLGALTEDFETGLSQLRQVIDSIEMSPLPAPSMASAIKVSQENRLVSLSHLSSEERDIFEEACSIPVSVDDTISFEITGSYGSCGGCQLPPLPKKIVPIQNLSYNEVFETNTENKQCAQVLLNEYDQVTYTDNLSFMSLGGVVSREAYSNKKSPLSNLLKASIYLLG